MIEASTETQIKEQQLKQLRLDNEIAFEQRIKQMQSETRLNDKRASWHGWIGGITLAIAVLALFKEPLIKLIQG